MCIYCLTSQAQPNDFLFMIEDWYLSSLEINGTSFPIPSNAEVDDAIIRFYDTTPFSFSASVCGELTGEISYPSKDTFLFPAPLIPTGDSCTMPVNQDFEAAFFNFFNSDLVFDYQTAVVDPDPPNYYVFITNANGDVATFTEKFIPLNTEAISEKPFALYPNPVSDKLFISAATHTDFKLRILNISGVVLKEDSGSSTALSGYPKGVYFVEITDGDGKRYIEKIIKK